MNLTLYLIWTLTDASASDSFLKTWRQNKNFSSDQFFLLSPCFQLCTTIVLSFKGSFQLVSGMFSKSSAAHLLYVGKGYTGDTGFTKLVAIVTGLNKSLYRLYIKNYYEANIAFRSRTITRPISSIDQALLQGLYRI